MQVIDMVFTALILLFIVHGLTKGFIGEVFSVAAVALGLLASLLYNKPMGTFLADNMAGLEKFKGAQAIPNIIAFVLLFLLVFVFVKIIESMLKGIIQSIHLGGLDKILGATLGIAEGLIIVFLMLVVFKMLPSAAFLEDSFFARLLGPLIDGGVKPKPRPETMTAFVRWLSRMAASV